MYLAESFTYLLCTYLNHGAEEESGLVWWGETWERLQGLELSYEFQSSICGISWTNNSDPWRSHITTTGYWLLTSSHAWHTFRGFVAWSELFRETYTVGDFNAIAVFMCTFLKNKINSAPYLLPTDCVLFLFLWIMYLFPVRTTQRQMPWLDWVLQWALLEVRRRLMLGFVLVAIPCKYKKHWIIWNWLGILGSSSSSLSI